MLRFVVLEHDYPILHWDLMLEAADVLRTWRLDAPPTNGKTIPATYLAGHRRMYLDYEGPVSRDRGRVVRWDQGVYSMLEDADDHVSAVLQGRRFQGRIVLSREKGDAWILRCSNSPGGCDMAEQ